MTTDEPKPIGYIVLKASTKPEVAEIGAQLNWYADFGDPFENRYEGGWVVRGAVRAEPTAPTGDGNAEAARLREQATKIAEFERQVETLQREIRYAQGNAKYLQGVFDELTVAEQSRLIERRITMIDISETVVEPGEDDEDLQTLVRDVLDRAARRVQEKAPDIEYVDLRAADACAAIVRSVADEPPRMPDIERYGRRRRRRHAS